MHLKTTIKLLWWPQFLSVVSVSADAPDIVSVPTVVAAALGEDAVLECTADANPLSRDTVTWSRSGFDFSSGRVSRTAGNGSSVLTIRNVTREDAGLFLCRANNGIGMVNASAALLVERE